MMSLYTTTVGGMLADGPGRAWSETEAGLFMLLFGFNQVWIPILLMATMALTIGRRRPGRLLALGFLGRVTSMRNRVEALSLALGDAGGWPEQDKRALALRMTERRRWDTARLWWYGPSLLASLVMVYGALGGWGGQPHPWPVISALLFLAVSGAALGAEAWSRRRADPYGNAVRAGMSALEALLREDSADSRFRSVWRTLRSNDRRPSAYFSVDWTYRTVEEFCLSMEHLARYAVRSGDSVGRARRLSKVQVFNAHIQEELAGYCEVADANAVGDASDAEARAARSRVSDLIAPVLMHLCHDRLVLPVLAWDDLPEDRRNAPPLHAARRTIRHSGLALLVVAALAALFTWVEIPGEFASPLLIVLGGIVTVLLPRARWPE
ncbi:hypothetical protein B9W68_21475 [Streptomyces sp. CS227]|uniref:hypothetical protein n=1 Tax=Streptomyces sp. CS227 TaxID=1982763 RepID=UPI000B4084D5|nr:hypothetical protein [Streptomyces sp. CS227]OWA06983.1 hypothetical protein B9W68_21475 [Streptomyces sp. CS227]